MTAVADGQEARVTTVEDAGRRLGIGRGTAYSLARAGTLPGVIKLGGRYVVSVAVLERLLNGESQTAE